MPDILQPRDYYKPFAYGWAFDAYRTMVKMRWDPEEVPMAEDVFDWANKLVAPEKNFLTQVFRFFTQGDVDVACAYRDRYMPAFKHPEISMMLYEFAASEANHVFAYSFLLDTMGFPEIEYRAFHAFDEMRAKHEYLFKQRPKSTASLALDLAVFSGFSEGMQLFSSFAMLMNFQRRGLMKGMSTIIEWSIRDESHHVEFMTKLFRTLLEEHPEVWTDELKRSIYQACKDMVDLEDRFIDLAFAMGPVEGMSAPEVKQFIRYIADRRLNALGLKSNYLIEKNPFPWIDWIISAPTHTNFFEQRSTDYASGTVEGWTDAFDE